MITILRLFDDYDTAVRAVGDLERAGIPYSDISILANNSDGWYESDSPSSPTRPTMTSGIGREHDGVGNVREGADTGAVIGGTVGGVAGLLAGLGMLAIPGIGPVVAAGWLVSTAVLAVGGGAVGGIIGALTQAGVSEDDAHVYAEGVRRGGTLVTARVPEADAVRVEAILDRSGVDIRERATLYEHSGWRRFDPNAAPYTADEIRRERETFRTRV